MFKVNVSILAKNDKATDRLSDKPASSFTGGRCNFFFVVRKPANMMEVRYKFSKIVSFYLLFLILITQTISSGIPRPRGVSLSRAPLYNPEKNFICFDNSKTIPFSQVNDDFCDCPDASDEPGTSACPHGVFYCTNAGHKPLNLPSSRVNDGICDCCDGADEYSDVKCINNCIELGKTAREEAQRREELIKAGQQHREQLIQRGIQLKQEKKEKLTELQKNKEEAGKVKLEKENIKKQAEDRENAALEYYRKLEEEVKQKNAEAEENKNKAEAIEVFKQYDSNQDGKVDLSELQTRIQFDKDKNGEVSIEEAKFFLNNEESVYIEQFITSAWPNIKPFLMMSEGLFKPPEPETKQDIEEDSHSENEEHTEEGGEADEGHEDIDEDEEEEETEPDHTEEPVEEQQQPVSPSVQYDDETQHLVELANAARTDYEQAERSVNNLDSEIKSITDYLDKDFGPEEEFASLQDECYEYTDHEYVYKLCPFDKTVQQPKSGSSETRLGTWGRWDGPDYNKYEVMLYEKGQACWNGPQRSTQVKIGCGGENKITSVTEPNKCEYLFEFITPAACSQTSNEDQDGGIHDEL